MIVQIGLIGDPGFSSTPRKIDRAAWSRKVGVFGSHVKVFTGTRANGRGRLSRQ